MNNKSLFTAILAVIALTVWLSMIQEVQNYELQQRLDREYVNRVNDLKWEYEGQYRQQTRKDSQIRCIEIEKVWEGRLIGTKSDPPEQVLLFADGEQVRVIDEDWKFLLGEKYRIMTIESVPPLEEKYCSGGAGRIIKSLEVLP